MTPMTTLQSARSKVVPLMLLFGAAAVGLTLRLWTENRVSTVVAMAVTAVTVALCIVVALCPMTLMNGARRLIRFSKVLPPLWWLALVAFGVYLYSLTLLVFRFGNVWSSSGDGQFTHLAFATSVWTSPTAPRGIQIAVVGFLLGHLTLGAGLGYMVARVALPVRHGCALRVMAATTAIAAWSAVVIVFVATAIVVVVGIVSQWVIVPASGWLGWAASLVTVAVVLTVNWLSLKRSWRPRIPECDGEDCTQMTTLCPRAADS